MVFVKLFLKHKKDDSQNHFPEYNVRKLSVPYFMLSRKIRNIVLIVIGTIFVVLGIIGILIPGLPTTPFLLLAGYCYFNSSKNLHNWLLNHRLLGKFIQDFEKTGSIPLSSKIIAIALMFVTCSSSILFFIKDTDIQAIIVIAGITGLAVIVAIPSRK